MHTRASSLRWTKEPEKEGRVEEKEVTSVEDVEMVAREEVRGDPNLLKIMELMKQMKEETNDNLKQINEKFDRNDESLKEINEKIVSTNESTKEDLRQELKQNNEKIKQQMKESFRKLSETLDSGFKKLHETLNSTSEGIKETLDKNRDCLLYTSRCV